MPAVTLSLGGCLIRIMNKLVEPFYEIYIKKLNKVFPAERTLIFLVYVISLFYMKYPSESSGFLRFMSTLSIRDLIDFDSGLIAQVTLGQISGSAFMTATTIFVYKILKRISFWLFD